jgi:hypothetical protein
VQYPKEVSYVRKFLVSSDFTVNDLPADIEVQTFKETITFLNEPVTEFDNIKPGMKHISFVKLRESRKGSKTYSYILRILSDNPEERLEIRRTLNKDDYLRRKRVLVDSTRKDLRKQVSVSVYDNNIYYLDTIKAADRTTTILRVMSSNRGQDDSSSIVPSFVPVQSEITSNL